MVKRLLYLSFLEKGGKKNNENHYQEKRHGSAV